MQPNDLALRGRHNVYNSLAAAVAARVVEVRSDVMRKACDLSKAYPIDWKRCAKWTGSAM